MLEQIVFYLVLIDSVFANIMAWGHAKWYEKNFKGLFKQLPLTKAWAAAYIILVLWIGCALIRLNVL